MGRPNQIALIITHFSHPHPLRLTAASYPPSATAGAHCTGCALPAASSTSYSCAPCGFHLHFTCASLHPLLLHPCDPAHGLALLPSPPYSDRLYTCDACARPGSGFVYHCAACGLDLHTLCAKAPATVSCPAHPQHVLALTLASPYGEGKGFTCDLCGQSGAPREWLYRCATCEFDVHLVCSGGVAATPELQLAHRGSYSGGGTLAGGRGMVQGFIGGGGGFGGGGGGSRDGGGGTGGGGGTLAGGRGRLGGLFGRFGYNVAEGLAVGIVQGLIGGGGGFGGGFGGSIDDGGETEFVSEMDQDIDGGNFENSDFY